MERWLESVYRRQGVAERDRPHDLDHGGEDTQAYLKYNECIGLSEVEGLGRGIRVQFL